MNRIYKILFYSALILILLTLETNHIAANADGWSGMIVLATEAIALVVGIIVITLRFMKKPTDNQSLLRVYFGLLNLTLEVYLAAIMSVYRLNVTMILIATSNRLVGAFILYDVFRLKQAS